MPRKIKYLLLLAAIIAISARTDVFSFAQSGQGSTEIDPEAATMINREIKSINGDIDDKKTQIKRLQDKQSEYAAAIKEKQQEKSSLNNQLSLLDNRIAKSELDIELVEVDIEKVKLEIRKTDIAIEDKNQQIEKEKEQISDILKLIHHQDKVGSLEIILLNDNLSDFLNQVKYLEDMNEGLNDSLKNLDKHRRQLLAEKENLDSKKQELAELAESLEKRKIELAEEKDNKLYILDQVGKSEREYQRLLALAKKEQDDASAEIASMEKLVRAKLSQLEGNKLEFNDNGLVWPVTKNVITAYFHDPDYPFRNIFEHPAVDIRAGQGSVLKAAASGYVARVKFDGSSSYGYIMLIHGDGLSTVYGHVSKAYVSEDDYVVQGQKIGLSGGMPGTPGAGSLTTGPHLHFEVRLNGIPVDPLSYLP